MLSSRGQSLGGGPGRAVNVGKVPRAGRDLQVVEMVGPFPVQQSEVETGHAGHHLVFPGSRWSSQQSVKKKLNAGPPLTC